MLCDGVGKGALNGRREAGLFRQRCKRFCGLNAAEGMLFEEVEMLFKGEIAVEEK